MGYLIATPSLLAYRTHLTSFFAVQGLQESRFNRPSNYKGSGDWKIMNNDCQNHETHMGVELINWGIDLKWVL
jgi:hypothetical protein